MQIKTSLLPLVKLRSFWQKRSLFWFLGRGLLIFCSLTPGHALKYTCTLTTQSLNFGTIIPIHNMSTTTTTTVSVTCTLERGNNEPVNYIIRFSPGKSGNQLSRHMTMDQNHLSYNIYSCDGCSQILGDGQEGTYQFSHSYILSRQEGETRTDTFVIHGHVPSQPLAQVGTYQDMLTVTLDYFE